MFSIGADRIVIGLGVPMPLIKFTNSGATFLITKGVVLVPKKLRRGNVPVNVTFLKSYSLDVSSTWIRVSGPSKVKPSGHATSSA